MMLLDVFLLVLGFLALGVCSNTLIDHAAKIAKHIGVSEAVIGLTLLGFGTSLPELVVSVYASIASHGEISVSNIVGSNIFNAAIVVGTSTLIFHARITVGDFAKSEGEINLLTPIAITAILLAGAIPRATGGIMLLILAIYILYMFQGSRPPALASENNDGMGKSILIAIASLAAILVSGKVILHSAVNIALALGTPEWVIGASVIALGTSLPEYAVSIVAARKGKMAMSLANIVGSNIFNIYGVLGIASVISPIAISYPNALFDSAVLFITSAILSAMILSKKCPRSVGLFLIVIYCIYIYHLTGAHAF
ncbi:MAG: hypothetical protein DRN20_03950 [Thermoplasmata archaeon]|nr:MAG: hypothetical protein DRN20_03950 [Thermoplasmata archaeon]